MDLRRQYACIRRLRDLPLQNRELVPSQPRDQIALTRAVLQTLRNLLQQQISDRVAKRVIDGFELVQVEDLDRKSVV